MGAVLDTYRRYVEYLGRGDYQALAEVVDGGWIENCFGLTGWTVGLDVASANFAAGIASAFSDLTPDENVIIETSDSVVIQGRMEAAHSGWFMGIEPTGKRVAWDFVDLYRIGADGRINWHVFAADWNHVRLQLLDRAPDLPTKPTHIAVQAELASHRRNRDDS